MNSEWETQSDSIWSYTIYVTADHLYLSVFPLSCLFNDATSVLVLWKFEKLEYAFRYIFQPHMRKFRKLMWSSRCLITWLRKLKALACWAWNWETDNKSIIFLPYPDSRQHGHHTRLRGAITSSINRSPLYLPSPCRSQWNITRSRNNEYAIELCHGVNSDLFLSALTLHKP